ncbi:MAG: TetR/AcrR family transcriptional regulator [Acidimicrobiia bacterium]
MARLPAAERRRQLLDTALEVFGTSGYHGASMAAVAEAAGVTKPVLYQHFTSKRDLFLQLLADVGARLGDVIAKSTADATGPHAQVTAGFEAYFAFVAENEAAFRLLFGSGTFEDPAFSEAVRQVEGALAEAVAGLIHADLDDEHRRLLGHGIVGLAETTVRHLLGTGGVTDPAREAKRVADLAWAGLRGVHRI